YGCGRAGGHGREVPAGRGRAVSGGGARYRPRGHRSQPRGGAVPDADVRPRGVDPRVFVRHCVRRGWLERALGVRERHQSIEGEACVRRPGAVAHALPASGRPLPPGPQEGAGPLPAGVWRARLRGEREAGRGEGGRGAPVRSGVGGRLPGVEAPAAAASLGGVRGSRHQILDRHAAPLDVCRRGEGRQARRVRSLRDCGPHRYIRESVRPRCLRSEQEEVSRLQPRSLLQRDWRNQRNGSRASGKEGPSHWQEGRHYTADPVQHGNESDAGRWLARNYYRAACRCSGGGAKDQESYCL
ncbi:unnamed protein product, partial [Prorocentrum cordatum]